MERETALQLPDVHSLNRYFKINPTKGFQQIENRLYVFGIEVRGRYDSRTGIYDPVMTLGVCFYDLSTNTWNMDEIYTVESWILKVLSLQYTNSDTLSNLHISLHRTQQYQHIKERWE